MARLPPLLPWRVGGAALVAATAGALTLSGCQREISCTAEVTEAKGVFRGTVKGVRSRVDLEREALRAACGQLCGAQELADAVARDGGAVHALGPSGCVSRCSVDAEAGKIGKRSTCTEGSSP
jgi:hypothetical protein